MKKRKFASVSLTVRDRAISMNPQGIWPVYPWQFSKNIPLPTYGSHFEFLPKIEKRKFASISLTMQDRAISSKFSTQPMQKGMKLK